MGGGTCALQVVGVGGESWGRSPPFLLNLGVIPPLSSEFQGHFLFYSAFRGDFPPFLQVLGTFPIFPSILGPFPLNFGPFLMLDLGFFFFLRFSSSLPLIWFFFYPNSGGFNPIWVFSPFFLDIGGVSSGLGFFPRSLVTPLSPVPLRFGLIFTGGGVSSPPYSAFGVCVHPLIWDSPSPLCTFGGVECPPP